MAWYQKEQPTPFDNTPIDGLFFLDGDALAWLFIQHWTEGQKMPMIAFPSDHQFELWETGRPDRHQVHLFGEMDVVLEEDREEAFASVTQIAQHLGYVVSRVGDSQLKIIGYERTEAFLLSYDNVAKRLVDIQPLRIQPSERARHPAHILMTDELKQKLPPLYHGEQTEQHLEAPALVKYFHPLSGWTWYASEFDGTDMFFGVVAGFEIEMGFFTLSELSGLENELGLAVERDLYYTPQTLQEILNYHRRLRRQ